MGKPEFYEKVKDIVQSKKEVGYHVYYELVKTEFNESDSIRNIIRMKARKLKGFSGTYKENSSDNFFSKYIQQPDYDSLGIDSSDHWADVNYLELINYWEKTNGSIILDSIDLNTPFDQPFKSRVPYTQKEYNQVFIKYRNFHLINEIFKNNDDKILILYGKGHYKDLKKQLKKFNSKLN